MNDIPGRCDHCDRPATSYFGHWDGGAPGVGTHRSAAHCDYHMGDPPGSIPGRCWACGKAIDGSAEYWIYTGGVEDGIRYANFHPGCPRGDDIAGWDGPRDCGRCDHPIAYGQERNEHPQPRFNRTLYSHKECPR